MQVGTMHDGAEHCIVDPNTGKVKEMHSWQSVSVHEQPLVWLKLRIKLNAPTHEEQRIARIFSIS